MAPFLITFIFGNEFIPSVFVLQTLVWILIFIFPTNFLDYFLVSYHKEWLDFWLTLIPVILNVGLNFILIPQYGIFGTVSASLFAQALNFLLTLTASVLVLKRKLV